MLLFFKIKFEEYIRQREVKRLYYQDPIFKKMDLALLHEYRFKNPYRISKNFLKKQKAKNLHTYGETPLKAFDQIHKRCPITPSDIVLELGCGRGRGCFFLACRSQCEVIGIERIPIFVHRANKFMEKSRVSFHCEDMLYTNLSRVTVIYFNGLCLEEDFIEAMTKRFEGLKSGTKIITVSFPLSEYAINPRSFKIIDLFEADFPWGQSTLYINEVCHGR